MNHNESGAMLYVMIMRTYIAVDRCVQLVGDSRVSSRVPTTDGSSEEWYAKALTLLRNAWHVVTLSVLCPLAVTRITSSAFRSQGRLGETSSFFLNLLRSLATVPG
jgi:hypothetical protein